MLKRCINCNFVKPIELFQIVKKNKHHARCIDCRREYDRNYHKNRSLDKKKIKITQQDRRRLNIYNLINNYKSKIGCFKCGENDFICLDFHHINNDKEINIADAVRKSWSIERLAIEIIKCVVICSNCHRKLHRDEKSSP